MLSYVAVKVSFRVVLEEIQKYISGFSIAFQSTGFDNESTGHGYFLM